MTLVKINKLLVASTLLFSFYCTPKNGKSEINKVDKATLLINKNEQDKNSISYFENNKEDYFIKEIDINKDGIFDKIVSSKPYRGEKLFFFVKNEGSYHLVLESVNFSQDGGNIIKEVYPSNENNEVVIIHTFFPDRGNFQSFYHISYDTSGEWILSKTKYETTYWQDSKTYICNILQNINMKDFVSSDGFDRFNHIPEKVDKSKKCLVKS